MHMRAGCVLTVALLSLTLFGRAAAAAAGESDAERNQSTEMNAGAYGTATSGGDIRVVFIGNSITLHGAAPQIGWTNVWGMAASAREKDYVHLVAAGIARETGRTPELRFDVVDQKKDAHSRR